MEDIYSREFSEAMLYVLLSTSAVVWSASHLGKDLQLAANPRSRSDNEPYISMAIKIWSGLFIVVVAVVLLITGTSLPMRQLNSFLVLSLSGVLVDQLPIFAHVFLFMSATSWFEIYSAFLTSPPGITVSGLLTPKWIVAFYAMTSTVLSGHLRERTKALHPKSSVFQMACIVFACSISVPLKLLHNAFPDSMSFVSRWNEIPLRLRDMDLGPHHRLVCLVFMLLLHIGTRHLILSADAGSVSSTDKKTDSASAESFSNKRAAASPYHRFQKSGPGDVEGENEGAADEREPDLPPDCVEVSEEEAVLLVEGKGGVRIRNGK